MCLNVVFGYPVAFEIGKSQQIPCLGYALVSGLVQPFYCLNIVLGDTLAIVVGEAKIKLCVGIALVSGLVQPFDCFDIVLGDTLAWSYPVSVDSSGLVSWATPKCFSSKAIGQS